MYRSLFISVFALSSCASFNSSNRDTLAPLIDPPAATSTSTLVTVTTTVSAKPSSTSSATPQIQGAQAFPTNHPDGSCTPRAIGENFGVEPETEVSCSGSWAITRVLACPPETECEGLDVFRWTTDGWQHRGFHYSLCASAMDVSGLPQWAFDELIGFSLDCDIPIRYVPESATGTLSIGDKGPRVERLQQRLRDLSLLRDTPDSYFGRNTSNAVIDFQFLVGLNPDGIVGPKTAIALGLPDP